MSDAKISLNFDDGPQASLAEGLNVAWSNGVTLLYSTPLLRHTVAEAGQINPGLARAILAREQQDGGVRVSNTGGWQSGTDFLDAALPELATLKKAIAETLKTIVALSPELGAMPAGSRQVALHGWANVNRDSHYNRLHTHPGSHWSGVYYVSTGEPDPARPQNGVIEFHDPRHISATMRIPGFRFGQQLEVQPFPGLMLLFPSWLEHWVTPFHGKGERISIAYNLQITTKA